MSTRPEIDLSDEALFERALADAAEALGRYAAATNDPRGAIKFLSTLSGQFDQARRHVLTVRRQRQDYCG